MVEQSKRGYLVLADISGYTSFLASVELEHAHEILADLLEVIVDKFKSILTISKLEGDAVFAYVLESKIPRGEALLELIESTYVAFRQRRDSSNRATTCTCRACQSMPSLELKFFVHHGNFIVQRIAGIRELVGSDVNLAHRLMKNHITEHTNWTAYALFTKDAMNSMGLILEDVHDQTESYEHLGDIETVTVNLIPRFDAIVASQKFHLTEGDADFSLSHEYELSQSELWQMVTSTEIFTAIWNNKTIWHAVKRPGGRNGVGAVNHCMHGDKRLARYTIVDWQPFDYFTSYLLGAFNSYEMYEIKPIANSFNRSILSYHLKLDSSIPRWIVRLYGKITMSIFFKNLEKYIADLRRPTFQPEAD
ncbi:MAG TPA: hypothetical protein DCX53_14630 [Anaerolineae bacterium]|nr:hypothetical protein [Anaerolineae bacterium]